MSLTKDLDRALQAKQLLENPIYVESFEIVRNGIINAWENSPIRDTEGQHELRLMLKLLNDLQNNIKRVVDSGKLAEIEIERQKKPLFNVFKRA
jgi:hypothetical protein